MGFHSGKSSRVPCTFASNSVRACVKSGNCGRCSISGNNLNSECSSDVSVLFIRKGVFFAHVIMSGRNRTCGPSIYDPHGNEIRQLEHPACLRSSTGLVSFSDISFIMKLGFADVSNH